MAVLRPAPFSDLVTRLFLEPRRQDALFELPRRKWYVPRAGGPDLSVRFLGRPAGNPAGPAAGPHTQMAQNLLLSYVAGARILELKTVQVNDQLTIGRPCIDMTNVGYNIEWSQELRIEESLREYTAGAMLIEMFRCGRLAAAGTAPGRCAAVADEYILDLSVGYDLAGIRSDAVRAFLDGMRDASTLVEQLRGEIPACFAHAREQSYPTRLSDSITLSTFHGCPADEIERIVEHLVGACDFDVVVKLNPPSLGREKLEHLLHDVLGYHELRVNPAAYETMMPLSETVELSRRLTAFAARHNHRVGFKFSNTLEVLNHRPFFPRGTEVMYLSGQPLHVITLALTAEFRQAAGAHVPISFSAGIDRQNFPLAAACGFVPITVSTDLLRPGGYGRMPGYLESLSAAMQACGAATVAEYVLKFAGSRAAAGPAESPDASDPADADAVARASVRNTAIVAELARNDPRYRAERNRAVPKRVESELTTFDCLTCDKCLPVCPNAANFTYPTPKTAFRFADVLVDPDGSLRRGEPREFAITEAAQIACFADFCNECGNCDTFCPEYGGPYIRKPSFFGSEESWRAAPRDGFVVLPAADGAWRIRGRIRGVEYELLQRPQADDEFDDGVVRLIINRRSCEPIRAERGVAAGHRVDLWAYHVMRHLLSGVRDARHVNQVNAAWAADEDAALGAARSDRSDS